MLSWPFGKRLGGTWDKGNSTFKEPFGFGDRWVLHSVLSLADDSSTEGASRRMIECCANTLHELRFTEALRLEYLR